MSLVWAVKTCRKRSHADVCSWPQADLRGDEMHGRPAEHAQYLIGIAGRRDSALRDGNDLDAANEIYKVKLAVAVAPQMQKSTALLSVELEAFEIAEAALPSGNTPEFKPIAECGGELSLSALALGAERDHVVENGSAKGVEPDR